MERKPRSPEEPMLTRALLIWLGIAGLVMGGVTLGVIWWGSDHYDDVTARTIGLTTFAFSNLFFSFCVRDELRSAFSLDVLEDKRFLIASGISFAAIVLGPQLDLFHRILHTVDLTFHQWLICIVGGLAIVLVSEARKFLLRRNAQQAEAEGGTQLPAAA